MDNCAVSARLALAAMTRGMTSEVTAVRADQYRKRSEAGEEKKSNSKGYQNVDRYGYMHFQTAAYQCAPHP